MEKKRIRLTGEAVRGKLRLVVRHSDQGFMINEISVLPLDDNPVVGEDASLEDCFEVSSDPDTGLSTLLLDMPDRVRSDAVHINRKTKEIEMTSYRITAIGPYDDIITRASDLPTALDRVLDMCEPDAPRLLSVDKEIGTVTFETRALRILVEPIV